MMTIQIKSGQQQDTQLIAHWINNIGHGHIDYLLDGLVKNKTALQHIELVLCEDPDYSYKNVDLITDGNDTIGLVFSYSSHSNELKPEMEKILSGDRVQWMRYFSDNQIEGSWYINTLGVAVGYQRQGFGKQLLDCASKRALQNNFQTLSLHVYEDNIEAINLYESYGFRKVKKIDLSEHPFFVSRNLFANYLMECDV